MGGGGCPVVVAQWQSTGSSSQECTVQLLAFHLPIFLPCNIKMSIVNVDECEHVHSVSASSSRPVHSFSGLLSISTLFGPKYSS